MFQSNLVICSVQIIICVRFCSEKKGILKELHHLLSYESNFQVFRNVLDKVMGNIITSVIN